MDMVHQEIVTIMTVATMQINFKALTDSTCKTEEAVLALTCSVLIACDIQWNASSLLMSALNLLVEDKVSFSNLAPLYSFILYLGNKYYHTAIVSVIFIFLTAILYLVGAILICKKEGSDWLPGGDEDGENDVSFNQFDLNQSLNRNSWKKSRNQSRAVEVSDAVESEIAQRCT